MTPRTTSTAARRTARHVAQTPPRSAHALRQAEKYFRQGLLPEAVSEYLRFVAENPGHWPAIHALGDLLVRAGRFAEAVEQYARVAERLHDADPGKAAVVCRKILALKGSVAHEGVRRTLVGLCMNAGDPDRAAAYAARADEWKWIADQLLARGQEVDAVTALERALDDDPSDDATRLRLVRWLVTAGNLERARACLPASSDHPDLLLARVQLELLAGDAGASRIAAARALRVDATRARDVAALSLEAPAAGEAAFACLDAATDAMAAAGQWAEAARALEDYVARVPDHVTALMKLVEMCVDGDLAGPMRGAQASLADAYLQAGRAREARVIAEDLALENPEEPANIARFRRALELLGEPDPDAFIAERLSDEESYDVIGNGSWDCEPPISEAPPSAGSAGAPPSRLESSGGPDRSAANSDSGAVRVATARSDSGASRVATTPGAACVATAMRSDSGAVRVATPPGNDSGAVRAVSGNSGAVRAAATAPGARREALPEVALRLYEAGKADEAMAVLGEAVRSREHRFDAALLLARIHRDRGEDEQAIEWLERARHEAPHAQAAHEVLYHLAVTLGAAGETDRALAVFLELNVDAPGYRDVARQIRRLSGRS